MRAIYRGGTVTKTIFRYSPEGEHHGKLTAVARSDELP